MHGHRITIAAHLKQQFRPPPVSPSQAWSLPIADDTVSGLTLSGNLHRTPGATSIVILIHGLGGQADSGYVCDFVDPVVRAGMACLRVNLRGADRSGNDFYHAGLSSDVRAIVECPEVRAYDKCYVVGFSLGGHVSLHFAGSYDHKVAALASVCAPLDLAASGRFIDHPRRSVYRRHVLSGLKEMHRSLGADAYPSQLSSRELAGIRTLREWDEKTVVRRFGFASVDDYYQKASAGPRLAQITAPTLVVVTEHDPMIPASSLLPHLAERAECVSVWWATRGGHVAFPESARAAERVVGWLTKH